MEHLDSWVSSSSCSSSSRDEKVEPTELLEENWFFSNFFHRKTAMVRSASWSGCQEVTEITEVDRSNHQASISTSKLLPPQQTSKSKTQVQKEPKLDSPNKDIHELQDEAAVQHNMVRSPSLPPSVGRKIATNGVEESSHGSRKLMRQASLNSSSALPPQHVSKSMTPSSSIRRRTKTEIKGDIKTKESHRSSSKDTMNKTLSRRKTMSDLEIEELQGFMDLGFTFNKEDLDPSVVNIIPALRERSQEADNNWDEKKVRRPYLSEAWVLGRSSAPPIPSWLEKKSAGEDMKEQLKYWARAVASNVR